MSSPKPARLYSTKGAVNPARVQFFLAEKGLEIERVAVNLMAGEHKTDSYRKLAANGRVPALQLDDGTVICESVAICRYLEALHPEPPLLGRNPLERARVEMLDRMMEFELMLPMAMAFRHTFPAMKALEDQVTEFGEKQRLVGQSRMRRLDRELAGKQFLLGDTFCIADITAWCSLRFFRVSGFEVTEELANLHAWYQRIKARPAATAAFQ